LGVTFTELPFISLAGDVLNFGKIFANVGKIQKEAPLFIDPNYYASAMPGSNTTALYPERINIARDPNLRAEQLNSFEIGTTLKFFGSRVEFDGSWYSNTTSRAFVPLMAGSTMSLINGGTILNSGVELRLHATPVNQAITWNTAINFTRNRSIVQSLPEGIDRIALAGFGSISSSLIAGQPYGVLYGTRYLRNDEGKLVIGKDGFPIVDPVMSVLGNTNPDWMIGVENSFSFKGISLAFLIDIKKGGVIWNGTKNTLNYFGTAALTGQQREIKNYIFDGVTEEGTPNSVAVDFHNPANAMGTNRWMRYGVSGVAEDGIEDGSWVRLRQVSLSYKFPQNLAFRMGVKNLSLSLIGRNLFLLTHYSGIDPETNLTGNTNGRGLDYFNSPNFKSYAVSLKMGL
jgi:outer membrane receptor protein involved in Fe transport